MSARVSNRRRPSWAATAATISTVASVAVALPAIAQVALTPDPLPQPHIGQAYSFSLSASGGTAPYTYLVAAGPLPPGVTMSAGGTFSGTPAAQIPFAFTVVAADAKGREAQTVLAGVVGGFVLALAQPPDTGNPGRPYGDALVATGGVGPYQWSFVSGSLPPGLTLNPDGSISGTPTTTGTFVFVVHVVDANGTFADITVSLRIGEPQPVPANGPAGLALASLAIAMAAWRRQRKRDR